MDVATALDPNLLQKGAAFYHTYVESVQKAAPTGFLQLLMDGRPDWKAGTKYPDKSDRTNVALTRGLTVRECAACIGGIASSGGLEDALGTISNIMFCQNVVEKFGSEDQKKKWLPQASGEQKLGAYAIAEPEAGSDAAMIAAKVRLQGNDLVLSGKKSNVMYGEMAHYIIVFATGYGSTDEEKGRLSAFIVAANKKGIVKVPGILAGMHVAEIEFQDVRLSRDDLLGQAGQGYNIAQAGIDILRLTAASACSVAAREVFDKALADAKSRRQFGKAHIEFDMIAEKVVRMTEALHAMDAVVSFVASMADEGRDYAAEAAAARVFCARMAHVVADESLQVAGARGLAEESPYAKTLRDLRAFRFVGGADEVLKLYIALYGAKPSAEFIMSAKRGQSGAGAFDAAIKLWWKGFRLSMKRSKRATRQTKLADPGRICGEGAGILAERVHTIFKYYGGEVAEHEYELRRIADMAIELLVLAAVIARGEAVISGATGGDKELAAAAPGWRARRAWKRIARWSSEIFLADDLEMDKLAEKHLPE
ncbi:MAG: acyl-CoA dehydrogenase family protein [Candidatus Hydrogenedentota bacterium]